MTQHFTTPEFAQVIKQHGIDIDTSYRWNFTASAIRLQVIELNSFNWVTIDQHYSDEIYHDFYSPAYPLTEVLGWLPETIICEGKLHQIDFDTVNLTVGYARAKLLEMVWAIEPKNISDIIIQGLTEGWLTKDNLNVNS